jgi:hypothetical protein
MDYPLISKVYNYKISSQCLQEIYFLHRVFHFKFVSSFIYSYSLSRNMHNHILESTKTISCFATLFMRYPPTLLYIYLGKWTNPLTSFTPCYWPYNFSSQHNTYQLPVCTLFNLAKRSYTRLFFFTKNTISNNDSLTQIQTWTQLRTNISEHTKEHRTCINSI